MCRNPFAIPPSLARFSPAFRPPNLAHGKGAVSADRLRRLFGDGSGIENDRAIAGDLRVLDAARDALVTALGSYWPSTLGLLDNAGGWRSEPVEFLSQLYDVEERPVQLPHGELGQHLPARRVSFGQDTVELAPAGPLGRGCVA